MLKKTFILLLIIILIALIIMSIYPYFQRIEDNDEYTEDINKSVKLLVNEALRVQHRWHSEAELKKLFTDECRKEIGQEFFNKKWFYFVDKRYMQTLKYIQENELIVTVRISGFFSDDYNNIFRIIQKPDETFVITDIYFDP